VTEVLNDLSERLGRTRHAVAKHSESFALVVNDIIRLLNEADQLVAELKTQSVPTQWTGRFGVTYPLGKILVGSDGDRWQMHGWRPNRLTPVFENVSDDVHGLWLLDLQEVADRFGPLKPERGDGA
jgi:hypothetical protein